MKTPHTRYRFCLSLAVILAVVGGCFDYSNVPSSDADFLTTGVTLSHFRAIQVDPKAEDSAGPQFVVAEDLNGDGMTDLVSAWNQSQPVQIHLQRKSTTGKISFETITLAGNMPVVKVSGLGIADFDRDGHADIAVLVQETLMEGAGCPGGVAGAEAPAGMILTYFGPDDPALANVALAWQETDIGSSFLLGSGSAGELPEHGGYTCLTIGDCDMDNDMDIVVAWNGCDTMGVLNFINEGSLEARDGTWSMQELPTTISSRDSAAMIKDVAMADVDRDGDLDVVLTRPALENPSSTAMNVRWLRNPVRDVPDDYHISDGQWQVGTVAQISSDADIVRIADVDADGISDVIVRSSLGNVIQWLKGPAGPTSQPLRSIPWQVYTMAEFRQRQPQAMAVGDVTLDGKPDLIASAGGGLAWFGRTTGGDGVYDQWLEHLILDDEQPEAAGAPAVTDPNAEPPDMLAEGTNINSILIVDLDKDGRNDLVITLDRGGFSGLSNDALVWLRNTKPR